MTILGKLKNFTGYVNNITLIIKSQTSAGLTSVKMMGSTTNLPKNFNVDLTQKLTANVSNVGRYDLVPTGTKFTNLKYFGFYFEGGASVSLIEMEAEVEVWLV